MDTMLVCSSHSPLIYFPGRETDDTAGCRAALAAQRERVERFDPELVVMFGTDHYGGQSMSSMPPFCVATAATALADVGGFPGALDVNEATAEGCVDALRADGVDVAVSYAMEVDHGFSQALQEITGGVGRFPVLPIFVNCIAPPFVPFKRVGVLGRAVARYVAGLGLSRVLVLGTGGISHNPAFLFPPIHDCPPEWLPHHLLGIKQHEVPRQTWIDYQIDTHHLAAGRLAEAAAAGAPPTEFSIVADFDRRFLDLVTRGDLAPLDTWVPTEVVETAGVGAMEVLSWVASANCAQALGAADPEIRFQAGIIEYGVGFGLIESLPA